MNRRNFFTALAIIPAAIVPSVKTEATPYPGKLICDIWGNVEVITEDEYEDYITFKCGHSWLADREWPWVQDRKKSAINNPCPFCSGIFSRNPYHLFDDVQEPK